MNRHEYGVNVKALPIDYLKDIEHNPSLVVGKKWDGFSEVITVEQGIVRLFNRSGREHTLNVPALTSKKVSIPDCKIQAEGVGPDERLISAKSILGSHPGHAITFQNQCGPLRLVCHNLLWWKGESLLHIHYGDRIPALDDIVDELRSQGLDTLLHEQLINCGKYDYFRGVVAQGGEGVVVKNLRGIDKDFVKVKRVKTWDVVIVGFTEGKGKYSGVIGAIRYGAFKDGQIVEVGKCSGMTDAERAMFAAAPQSFLGRVIELKGQEVGSKGRIRFPAFLTIRDDKPPEECLIEHLIS